MEKSGYVIILSLALFILLLFYLAYSGINVGGLMSSLVIGYYGRFGDVGTYLGVFLISIFGNVTFIFPVPYVLALAFISLLLPVNIPLLGASAGLGATIGELSAWLVGRGARELFDETRHEKSLRRLKRLVEAGFTIPLIILFAATPLPDDLLLFVLGVSQYSIIKVLLTCFVGKLIMCAGVAWVVKGAAGTEMGRQVLMLFGIDAERIESAVFETRQEPWIPAVSIALTMIIFMALIMVDWEKLFKRIRGE
ncbi:MAG: VTT domain-containing protein [Candidatus Geothermarchaeales archaeon]